jgi:3-hydroxyisobutyrate dehydrogenase-like beta-hydroxyacid dehydrogenase
MFTAVRTWNRPHTKATVTLYKDGVELEAAGGKRAERANAVIVILQNPQSLNRFVRESDGIYGLRADLHAADVEAARLTKGGPRKTRGYTMEFTPVPCVAVPVMEGS